MDLMSKSLPNHEKVVRPALIYSLFPNVSPTIYFGTRDERGKCNQGTQSRGTHRGCQLTWMEGTRWESSSRMAFLCSVSTGCRFYCELVCPLTFLSLIISGLAHGLYLFFCLLPAFPLLLTCAQPPFHKGQFSKPDLEQSVVVCPRKEWAPLPSFSLPHCDPLPLPFPSGETSLGTEEAAPLEDEHSDS